MPARPRPETVPVGAPGSISYSSYSAPPPRPGGSGFEGLYLPKGESFTDPYEAWAYEQYQKYRQGQSALRSQGANAYTGLAIPGYALATGQGPLDPFTNIGKLFTTDDSFASWKEKNAALLKEQYKAFVAQEAEAKNRAEVDAYFKGQLDKLDTLERDPSRDPYYRQLTTDASNAASRQSAGRGIRGGLSMANTQSAYAKAATALALQRDQLRSGLNAARGQNQVAQGGLLLNENQWDYNQVMQKYAADQAKNAGQQGAIMGGLGAIAGAYFGKSPEAALAGYQAGTNYGQASGGLNTPYPSYTPRRSGGGGGGSPGLNY